MTLNFLPLDLDTIAALRAGEPDVYGNPAERAISDGKGKPCRCCLDTIPKGVEMLICAARPFVGLHPYAETGPIFLCAHDCTPYVGNVAPPVLDVSPDYLVKAYDADERIVYGTGQITAKDAVTDYAQSLFLRDGVTHVDVRSAKNNCFLTRIKETA